MTLMLLFSSLVYLKIVFRGFFLKKRFICKDADVEKCKENSEISVLISVVQPFSSHGTHKLITKILRRTKNGIFCRSDKKKKSKILIHPHWTAIVVLAVVIFSFDDLREKRSVPPTKQAPCGTLAENCRPKETELPF